MAEWTRDIGARRRGHGRARAGNRAWLYSVRLRRRWWPASRAGEGRAGGRQACLVLVEKRETRYRVQWYYRLFEETRRGLTSFPASMEAIHGSLLALGELLRHTGARAPRLAAGPPARGRRAGRRERVALAGPLLAPRARAAARRRPRAAGRAACAEGRVRSRHTLTLAPRAGEFMLARYREVVETVLRFRDSKEKLIRRAVIALVPRLAAFAPERFAATYLRVCSDHLLSVLRRAASGVKGYADRELVLAGKRVHGFLWPGKLAWCDWAPTAPSAAAAAGIPASAAWGLSRWATPRSRSPRWAAHAAWRPCCRASRSRSGTRSPRRAAARARTAPRPCRRALLPAAAWQCKPHRLPGN